MTDYFIFGFAFSNFQIVGIVLLIGIYAAELAYNRLISGFVKV